MSHLWSLPHMHTLCQQRWPNSFICAAAINLHTPWMPLCVGDSVSKHNSQESPGFTTQITHTHTFSTLLHITPRMRFDGPSVSWASSYPAQSAGIFPLAQPDREASFLGSEIRGTPLRDPWRIQTRCFTSSHCEVKNVERIRCNSHSQLERQSCKKAGHSASFSVKQFFCLTGRE